MRELGRRGGVTVRLGAVRSVDPVARVAIAGDGEAIAYDHLVLATGARALWAVPGATTFWRGRLGGDHETPS